MEKFHNFSIGMHWTSGTMMPDSIKQTEMKPVINTAHLILRKVKMRQYIVNRVALVSPLVVA